MYVDWLPLSMLAAWNAQGITYVRSFYEWVYDEGKNLRLRDVFAVLIMDFEGMCNPSSYYQLTAL